MPCSICQSYEHLVEECPTIPTVREMFGDQANVVDQFKPNNYAPYGSTYNSNWRNHPNFSWKPRPPQKGKFPSQPHQNPKGIHEVEAQEGESSKVREVKSVITLRSGKEVVQPAPKLKHGEEVNQRKTWVKKSDEGDHDSSVDEEPRIVIKEDMMKKHMPPPFPQALHVPTYAKFLKDLCTVKRGLNVTKKAFLTEQECYHPVQVSSEATSITLSLADRLVKIPRGIIEDVLVQVDKFYYPVYFVVLDSDPVVTGTNYVSIILGRPFLATSNAIINCRNGVMQLTFGNMTLELNIFHLCKNISIRKKRKGQGSVHD
ncbi:hypothetical protein CK203_066260 [Vitis vinifera]|uniref:Uncharacterized protein n=1 Tax=Vitis vinifera TaxID=29760 RepID=A0A438GBJ0_VITVI|nr:hypothetical protein CK203_066260 [Vitis vinifera]